MWMRRSVVLLSLLALAAGCKGGEQQTPPAAETAASPATPPGGPQTPDAGRSVIVIEMLTDEQGNNVFRPAELEAHRGDVLRFTLVSGVHNAHFVADSNPRVPGLPAAGPLLQLPGQTYDVKVTFPEGDYYFQCDPHALLGMIGRLEVEEED